MRYNSFRDPSLGAADGGLFEYDIVLKPPPYEPDADSGLDEEALRLDREPVERPARRKPGRSRGLILGGWAVALGAALAVAVIVQPTHELSGQPDLPPAPPPAPAAGDEVGAPATAPPIASQPQFAQAPTAAETPAQPELQVADEVPPPPPPVEAPAPVRAQAAEFAPEPAPAEKVEKAATPPVKPKAAPTAKVEKVSAPTNTTDREKAEAHRAIAADAKDLPQLKARMTKAYALAVKAGTPKSVLKARQAEWLVLKAKAEKKGPQAVATLYKTRAAQLEALAKKTSARSHGKV
jgi:hypothetical protein